MTHQYPRWASPLGVKLTDWVAVIAFILSVGGLLWTGIARQLYPSTDVSFPEEIQLQCTQYDGEQKRCIPDSSIVLVGDLFSIWNDSTFSTKPQILKRIHATITSDNIGKFPFFWKYFTEIVDSANKHKGNSGRAILYYGDLRNVEVEFSQDQVADGNSITWATLTDLIVADDISVEFLLDFAYGDDKNARCSLMFRQEDISDLKNQDYPYHYIIANSVCEELTDK
ncbi:MAG: hypothetical protein F4Y60_00990 [Boseongicola sp. SB0664_bin_43]|uniref:Uncharacterized protein n=1 Tax=Boseongicola sp. SB0664_bin_43 TaxID=2604844 RepID=A0A6B0XYD7_9RHOB|nr:hypothetical protein [Boseongicola sp. SB0664_bin_43]